jgi:hypothetical protein
MLSNQALAYPPLSSTKQWDKYLIKQLGPVIPGCVGRGDLVEVRSAEVTSAFESWQVLVIVICMQSYLPLLSA